MEYYGLRPSGPDIDFVVTAADYHHLATLYPNQTKDLFGDWGVCVGEFELWQTILLFDYHFLAQRAIDLGDYRVIALDKLLFLKTLAIAEPKYEQDVHLLVVKIQAIQYGKDAQFGAEHFKRL